MSILFDSLVRPEVCGSIPVDQTFGQVVRRSQTLDPGFGTGLADAHADIHATLAGHECSA